MHAGRARRRPAASTGSPKSAAGAPGRLAVRPEPRPGGRRAPGRVRRTGSPRSLRVHGREGRRCCGRSNFQKHLAAPPSTSAGVPRACTSTTCGTPGNTPDRSVRGHAVGPDGADGARSSTRGGTASTCTPRPDRDVAPSRAALDAPDPATADRARSGHAGRSAGDVAAEATPALTWERMTGIEPALSAWEAEVLPLNYIRGRPPGVGAGRQHTRPRRGRAAASRPCGGLRRRGAGPPTSPSVYALANLDTVPSEPVERGVGVGLRDAALSRPGRREAASRPVGATAAGHPDRRRAQQQRHEQAGRRPRPHHGAR